MSPASCSWFLRSPVKVGVFAVIMVFSMLVAADLVVPGVIENAYGGNGPKKLNQFFETRRDRHSLGHYLLLWTNFRNACTIASAAFLAVLIIIDRCIECRRMRWFLVPFSAAFLGMTVLWGPRQDYVAHLKIWEETNAGRDPWWIQPDSGIVLNAYGPLFEAFAPLVRINPLVPKILFATAFLIYAVFTSKSAEDHATCDRRKFWLTGVWLANPFFWLEIAFYGHFDIIASLFALGAIVALNRSGAILAGTLLGLGFLLKFVPIVLLPFLAFENRGRLRSNGRLIASFIGTMIAGMAFAWGFWGDSIFRPLSFVSTRGSSLLSVWRYLKGPHSPLVWSGFPARDFDGFATPALILALAAIWLILMRRRTEYAHACLCALLGTVLFYRVGFVQYQMFPFLIMPYWYSKHRETVDTDRGIRFALIAYVAWIVGFDLFDNAVGGIVGHGRAWAWVEDWSGLPNFVMGMTLLTKLLRMSTIVDEPSSSANRSHFG
ncbi:DUF2029 domain-containing protein [bacterium]|nr:DUF2029 domain-containing protein [bacterium]